MKGGQERREMAGDDTELKQWPFHAGDGGGTGPQIVASLQISPAPKLWLGLPNLAVDRTLYTLRSIDSRKKITKFDAIRCQILTIKCTKFDFRWGSVPDPAGGELTCSRLPSVNHALISPILPHPVV